MLYVSKKYFYDMSINLSKSFEHKAKKQTITVAIRNASIISGFVTHEHVVQSDHGHLAD